MKAVIILAVVGAAIYGVVTALGSTLGAPEYENQETGVTGALKQGSVSVACMDAKIWREPRSSSTRKDRDRLFVGALRTGDVFKVTKHYIKAQTLWVHIVPRDDPDLSGWIPSPGDDPFMAKPLYE